MADELVEAVAKAIGLANHETPESITRLIRDRHGELVETWVTYLPLARAIIPLVRDAERADVVKWLRVQELAGVGIESVDDHIAALADDLADAIEAGEHTQESQ